MREQPLLLTDPLGDDGFCASDEARGKVKAERCLQKLNPAFVSAAGLVGLDWSAQCLTIGSREPLSPETRDALRFATGLDIIRVILPTDAPVMHGNARTLPTTPSTPPSQATSLFGLFGSWLDGDTHALSAFEPLATLLRAGFSPRAAGDILLEPRRGARQLQGTGLKVAKGLCEGKSLRDAGRLADAFPPYIDHALGACRDEADEHGLFVRLVGFEAECERRAGCGRAAMRETVILWLSLAVVWFQLFGIAGMAIVAAGCCIVFRLYTVSARSRINDRLRAEVLALVATLASTGTSVRSVIQSAMKRLQGSVPTWGRMPDTRDGLADALALDPVFRAVLMNGNLPDVSQHLSQDCAYRANAQVAKSLHVSRMVALVGIGTALALAL